MHQTLNSLQGAETKKAQGFKLEGWHSNFYSFASFCGVQKTGFRDGNGIEKRRERNI